MNQEEDIVMSKSFFCKKCVIAAAYVMALGFSSAHGADVTINFAQYSSAPTIGNGTGNDNPDDLEGYGALSIFIEQVKKLTARTGDGTVTFSVGGASRAENALRAGVQYVKNGVLQANPSWGFILNSVPFGMSFRQTLGFLYKTQDNGLTGIELVNSVLDSNDGSQVAFPVVGSTGQGSGYFPKPVGKTQCNRRDAECHSYDDGIGLAAMCSEGWKIRYLNPNQTILSMACDNLVEDGVIRSNNLTFYPSVGGQSVLTPMQARAIDGFEFVTPHDDFKLFFPKTSVDLECVVARPGDFQSNGSLDSSYNAGCDQNIGEIGARYAHYPSWHQPFLLSWMHIDRDIWNDLTENQQNAILRAAKRSVVKSYRLTASAQCDHLADMLDFNDGKEQLDADGMETGKSADILLVEWPEEALRKISIAADQYIQDKIDMPATAIDGEFFTIYDAWDSYRKSLSVRQQKYRAERFPVRSCNLLRAKK